MQKIQKLRNQVEIPSLGFGTFQIPDGNDTINAVCTAIEAGYRHIDGAAIYGNENGVGEGIRKSGIDREELFLTSKVWNSDHGYESTLQAFEDSLAKWQTDYLDLYLIHWPKPLNAETWKAMEKLYRDGRVRAIGVCNFTTRQMDELLKTVEIPPMVNQVELHPQFPQYGLQEYCGERGILIESWGPLMQGQIFKVPLIQELAEKYHCTVAQFAVAWQFQLDNISLVKSLNSERIRSNFAVPEITISDEDLERMESLEGNRIGPDPENFDF